MRIIPCVVLLVAAAPAFAQQAHTLDFRDSKFDGKLVDYTLANPKKYFTTEKEGLRLRFRGKDVPPARQTAGIFWRFDARGDFVVTAKYEILKIERPKTGQGVGVGIYVHLKNREQEGITIARRFQPTGEPFVVFNYMTTNEDGGTPSKVFKKYPTGDRSLRGAFRLSREGKVLIASFAEADNEFAELYRTDVSDADLDLIRFAGFGGGDTNAVLDMRILEYHFQGKDLVYYGPVVTTPAPILPMPVVRPDAPSGQVVTPVEVPAPLVTPPNEQVLPVAFSSAKPKSLIWVPISLSVGLVLTLTLVIGLGVWIRVRQGSANVPLEEPIIDTPLKGEEPILDTAIEEEEPPSPISFRCSACKKGLKVKAELAGKKVKCRQCAKVIVVPASKAGGNGKITRQSAE